jgi:hypothetical protein
MQLTGHGSCDRTWHVGMGERGSRKEIKRSAEIEKSPGIEGTGHQVKDVAIMTLRRIPLARLFDTGSRSPKNPENRLTLF